MPFSIMQLNNLSMTRKLQRELEMRLAEEWSGVAGKPLPKTPYPKTPYELAQEEKNNEPDPDEDGLPYSDSDSEDLGFKEEELEEFATVNKQAGSEGRPFVGKHFGELIGFIDRAYLDVMGAIVECIQVRGGMWNGFWRGRDGMSESDRNGVVARIARN